MEVMHSPDPTEEGLKGWPCLIRSWTGNNRLIYLACRLGGVMASQSPGGSSVSVWKKVLGLLGKQLNILQVVGGSSYLFNIPDGICNNYI